jgi:hypothetical protein
MITTPLADVIQLMYADPRNEVCQELPVEGENRNLFWTGTVWREQYEWAKRRNPGTSHTYVFNFYQMQNITLLSLILTRPQYTKVGLITTYILSF